MQLVEAWEPVAGTKVPTAHFTHAVEAGLSWYVPLAHCEQLERALPPVKGW